MAQPSNAREPLVLLAAGGTGGHLFPAQALAEVLARRAIAVDLATDHRAERFGDAFLTRHIHIIASDTLRRRSPVSLARTAGKLGLGVLQALRLMGRIRPAAVVGFGGYPTIPPVAAAALRSIPTVIHEQNAVMGRANRLLAPRVSAIATSFAGVVEREPELSAKVTLTGNPVRATVIAAATMPYAAPDATHSLALLVFGGSQGARIMADIVPAAIQRLDRQLQRRLVIAQQAREETLRASGNLCRHIRQRGSRCFLRRSSRQDGSRPSCRCPFRRFNGRRADGHRPARHPGAAAACARSGSVSQCRSSGECRGRGPTGAE